MNITRLPSAGGNPRPVTPPARAAKQAQPPAQQASGTQASSANRATVTAVPAQGSLLETIEQAGAAIQASSQGFSEAARTLNGKLYDQEEEAIETSDAASDDITAAVTRILENKISIGANVAVFRTADQMLGSLLNIHA